MDGVTILNSYTSLTFGWALMLAFGVIIAVAFAAVGIGCIVDGENFQGIFMIICAVCCMIGMLKYVPTTTFYEVILSDDVKFTEVTQHYEVQKVRGQIITVTEVKDATD